MVLTKKKVATLTTVLTMVYFLLLLLLPESIVGTRQENMLLFAPKLLFLAITAAIVTAFLLILIFKRDFLSGQIHTFNRYKYLLRQMVKRDFVARYRKSVLGILWSLLNPLLTMIVMTIVFSYMFRFQIENFPVYLLGGLMIYNFFNESTSLAMGSVIASEGIIKKIYVPKYIFPLARVISSSVNLLFSFIAFLLVFIVTGVPFKWTMLLLPIPIIYTFFFSMGVAMLLSSLAVFFRDLKHLYRVILLLWMYMTPLFYPVSRIPEWFMPIYGLNPLFHFVDYFRNLALWGTVPDLWSNMVCIGFSLASVSVGVYVFMSKQDRYILYM